MSELCQTCYVMDEVDIVFCIRGNICLSIDSWIITAVFFFLCNSDLWMRKGEFYTSSITSPSYDWNMSLPRSGKTNYWCKCQNKFVVSRDFRGLTFVSCDLKKKARGWRHNEAIDGQSVVARGSPYGGQGTNEAMADCNFGKKCPPISRKYRKFPE